MSEETKKFKTEIRQLLDLMVHSLYSNKDIFLRELIANAADAIDKARFESLTNQDIAADWEIKIETDKKHNIIKISDNGIGMTKDEVIQDIGTIAESGTRAFLSALEKKNVKDSPDLIGQFGVGFYSSFMVAEKVVLVSKKAGSDEPAAIWESDGKLSYTINEDPRTEQGTTVTLYLKSDCKSYLEEWKIREIIKKYSDFIEHPVKMPVAKKKEDGAKSLEYEIINSQKAIWLRSPDEVNEEDHKNFFSHLYHFGGEPLLHIHYFAEGTTEFKALLYIPSKAPFDLFFPEQRKKGLHLYIRRVFICDDCPALMPEYLRFVKGVVDSTDLPLNISREMLQDNPEVLKIQKNLVRKILEELKIMSEKNTEKYLSFYREFGRVLKEGVYSDLNNKERLQSLLMYETMNNPGGKLISLKEYLEKMPPEQSDIYYIIGENRTLLENSPHLEFLKSRGHDVLFMTDPIDEWVAQSITEYSGKKLKAVGKGEIIFDEKTKHEKEEKRKNASKKHESLLEYLKKQLEENIKDVRFSHRLTDSACCLVSDDYDPSPHMERIFKAMNQNVPKMKRILELNPDHPLIEALQNLYNRSSQNPKLAEFAELLYDQALLTEGMPVPDALKFSKRIAELMATGIRQEIGSSAGGTDK